MYKLEVLNREPAKKSIKTPVLFVHGAYVGAWCWNEHFMEYFSKKGISVTAFSLRGHGNSAGGIFNSHRLVDYVKDLETVLSGFDEPPVVVGHSMGCMVIQKYLQKSKDIKAACYLSPIPFHGVAPSSIEISMRDPMVMMQVNLVQAFGSSFATKEFARKALFSKDISDADLEKYRHRFQAESYQAIWDVSFLDLPIPERMCNVPKKFIGFGDDGIFSERSLIETAKRYGVEAEFIEGVAHMAMLDPRWQKVADRVIAWIKTIK